MSISGYTTVFRGEELQFPYKEAIKSLLGCCDEVVVLVTLKDGEDTDGTLANLQVMAEHDNRIKIYTQDWDRNEPLQDGLAKAKARSFCSGDWVIQIDADEILHEKDYQFYTEVPSKYPDNTLISVGCLDFFHTRRQIIVDGVANFKPRISKNLPNITHGLQKEFAEINIRTGKTVCSSMLSDGAGYINPETGEAVVADLFLIDSRIEEERQKAINEHQIYLNTYAEIIETTFNSLPYVFHYSCIDLDRKVNLQYKMWDGLWNLFAGKIDSIEEKSDIDNNLKREKVMHRINNTLTAIIDVSHPKVAEEYLSRIGK
jgi:glycosyltransferase involved in cell wall biosynthesis